MNKKTVLILGARSDIAIALSHVFAKSNYNIALAARSVSRLENDKFDIELRHKVSVTLHEFDALNIETHDSFFDTLPQLPQVAICAVGLMGTQVENEQYVVSAANVIRSNFEGPASILGVIANRFERRGSGCIIGISSVAGERGRATNYVYGSAKAGFTAFLSGLRNRLADKGVHVITVLPGFVATRMTSEMNLPEILTAQPNQVAEAVMRAVHKKSDTIYTKRIWWFIMVIIRLLPEKIFKKLKI